MEFPELNAAQPIQSLESSLSSSSSLPQQVLSLHCLQSCILLERPSAGYSNIHFSSVQNSCTLGIDPCLLVIAQPVILKKDVDKIKKLQDALEAQFGRLENKWNDLADEDPLEDDNKFDHCQGIYDKAKDTVSKHVMTSEALLLRARDQGTVQGGSAAEGSTVASMKVDDLLKPKELLSSDMTLEEADQWFETYRTFINHNEKCMSKMDASVKRAILNGCLDAKMTSALRTHSTITNTTKIDGHGGCLETLQNIFLEKNPLWLRRNWYFQYTQTKSETVEEWWARKLDKARDSQLDQMTVNQLHMLELISGIDSKKLRDEFSKQKDPKLDELLQIARNWQCSTDVNKNMESTVETRKATSNYKKGKLDN